jgi:hypothetical protein
MEQISHYVVSDERSPSVTATDSALSREVWLVGQIFAGAFDHAKNAVSHHPLRFISTGCVSALAGAAIARYAGGSTFVGSISRVCLTSATISLAKDVGLEIPSIGRAFLRTGSSSDHMTQDGALIRNKLGAAVFDTLWCASTGSLGASISERWALRGLTTALSTTPPKIELGFDHLKSRLSECKISCADLQAVSAKKSLIGQGNTASVYEIDGMNDYVLRVIRSSDHVAPLSPVFDPLPHRNIGQPIASMGERFQICKRQVGLPSAGELTGQRWGWSAEQTQQYCMENLQRSAALPQNAYDELAFTLLDLNKTGLRWDRSRADNLLIDAGTGFGIVDVASGKTATIHTATDMMLTILPPFKAPSSANVQPLQRDVIAKIVTACENTGLPIHLSTGIEKRFIAAGMQESWQRLTSLRSTWDQSMVSIRPQAMFAGSTASSLELPGLAALHKSGFTDAGSAQAAFAAKNYEAAEAFVSQLVVQLRAKPTVAPRDALPAALDALACVKCWRGDTHGAMPLLEESIGLRKAMSNHDPIQLATSVGQLAQLNAMSARNHEAAKLWSDAILLLKSVPDARLELGTALHRRGKALELVGAHPEAAGMRAQAAPLLGSKPSPFMQKDARQLELP